MFSVLCLLSFWDVAASEDLLAYWRLDSEVLTLKDHVGEANFTGYYQEYVERPFPSTYLLNELKSFTEYEDEIEMSDAKFTIMMDLKIEDTDAGYLVQWDNYYFKLAVYQTDEQKLEVIWTDKGGDTVDTTTDEVYWLDHDEIAFTYDGSEVVMYIDEVSTFTVTIDTPRTLTNSKHKFQLGQNTECYVKYSALFDKVLNSTERAAATLRLNTGCPNKIYIHDMEVPGNQYAVYRQCMQGYWLEVLCKYNDTSSWWQGTIHQVCDFSGIYGPDRAAVVGDDVVLIGNRENSTIHSQSVTWYFENGTKIEDGTRYTLTNGSDIDTAHLDWTQLKIKSVSYDDEMLYIVEFNFSSGVSIREHIKLDVMEIILFNEIVTETTNMSVDFRVWNNDDDVIEAGWVVDAEEIIVSNSDTTVLGATVSIYDTSSNGTSVDFTFEDDDGVNYTVNILSTTNGTDIIACNISGLIAEPICAQWYDEDGLCIDQNAATEFQYTSTTTYLDVSEMDGEQFFCNFTLNPRSIAEDEIQLTEIRHTAQSSILYDSNSRVIRAVFDTDQNLTFYINGFTQDSEIGAQLYFGYNDSNLYRNITVDFVEVRGDSKGLLRTSFIGCMLHDITLDTTIAQSVEWLNRYGQTVTSNDTHTYVYDLSSSNWYSTNLTVDNFYQQEYTCRIYFDPLYLTYVELTQEAIVGWWGLILTTFALMIIVYILSIAIVLYSKLTFRGPYAANEVLTHINTENISSRQYSGSSFYDTSTLRQLRTPVNYSEYSDTDEASSIEYSISHLGERMDNLLERSLTSSSSSKTVGASPLSRSEKAVQKFPSPLSLTKAEGVPSSSKIEEAVEIVPAAEAVEQRKDYNIEDKPYLSGGINFRHKIYDFFRRSFTPRNVPTEDTKEGVYDVLDSSPKANIEHTRGTESVPSAKSGLRKRTPSVYDTLPAGTTARTLSIQASVDKASSAAQSKHETSIPIGQEQQTSVVKSGTADPSLLYDVVQSESSKAKPTISLGTSVRASMASTSDDREYSSSEITYDILSSRDVKSLLRDPSMSGMSAKELRAKVSQVSSGRTDVAVGSPSTILPYEQSSVSSKAVTYDYLTESDIQSIISKVSDYTVINPEDSISNVGLYADFKSSQTSRKDPKISQSIPAVTKSSTSPKSSQSVKSIYKADTVYGYLPAELIKDPTKPLPKSVVYQALSSASAKSRISFSLPFDHDETKYSLGSTRNMRKKKGPRSSANNKKSPSSKPAKPPAPKTPSDAQSSTSAASTVRKASKVSRQSTLVPSVRTDSQSTIKPSSSSRATASTKGTSSQKPVKGSIQSAMSSVKARIAEIEKSADSSSTSGKRRTSSKSDISQSHRSAPTSSSIVHESMLPAKEIPPTVSKSSELPTEPAKSTKHRSSTISKSPEPPRKSANSINSSQLTKHKSSTVSQEAPAKSIESTKHKSSKVSQATAKSVESTKNKSSKVSKSTGAPAKSVESTKHKSPKVSESIELPLKSTEPSDNLGTTTKSKPHSTKSSKSDVDETSAKILSTKEIGSTHASNLTKSEVSNLEEVVTDRIETASEAKGSTAQKSISSVTERTKEVRSKAKNDTKKANEPDIGSSKGTDVISSVSDPVPDQIPGKEESENHVKTSSEGKINSTEEIFALASTAKVDKDRSSGTEGSIEKTSLLVSEDIVNVSHSTASKEIQLTTEDPEYSNTLENRDDLIQSNPDVVAKQKQGTLSKLQNLIRPSKSSKQKPKIVEEIDESSEDDLTVKEHPEISSKFSKEKEAVGHSKMITDDTLKDDSSEEKVSGPSEEGDIEKPEKIGFGKKIFGKLKRAKRPKDDEEVHKPVTEEIAVSEMYGHLGSYIGSKPSMSTVTSSSELTESSFDDDDYSYVFSDSTVAGLLKEYPGATKFDPQPVSDRVWPEDRATTESSYETESSQYSDSESASTSSSHISLDSSSSSDTSASLTRKSDRTSLVSGHTLVSLDNTSSPSSSAESYELSSGASGFSLSRRDSSISRSSSNSLSNSRDSVSSASESESERSPPRRDRSPHR